MNGLKTYILCVGYNCVYTIIPKVLVLVAIHIAHDTETRAHSHRDARAH